MHAQARTDADEDLEPDEVRLGCAHTDRVEHPRANCEEERRGDEERIAVMFALTSRGQAKRARGDALVSKASDEDSTDDNCGCHPKEERKKVDSRRGRAVALYDLVEDGDILSVCALSNSLKCN